MSGLAISGFGNIKIGKLKGGSKMGIFKRLRAAEKVINFLNREFECSRERSDRTYHQLEAIKRYLNIKIVNNHPLPIEKEK